jgi:uncharacterized membrane protein HdeD (DUF308 family)
MSKKLSKTSKTSKGGYFGTEERTVSFLFGLLAIIVGLWFIFQPIVTGGVVIIATIGKLLVVAGAIGTVLWVINPDYLERFQ